ncbi:MAG: flagellar M-ring protein FliF [Acidimicrobiia bacterium]|nr:flagellar M-ring protein FliF [Acidimicrobiia bacterium]
MAGVQDLRQKLAHQLRGFSRTQKIGMAVAAVAVILGVLVAGRFSGKPDLAPLFTDLEASDAAAVTERLTSDGVPYELGDGGRTVLVPRDQLYELRINLAASGLPSGGTSGWSVLDDQGITASEFSQRVGYQRALEGELSKMVSSLDAVETATVRLVLPRDDAFALSDSKSSASVLIRTRPGRTLEPQQVQAIVNLVSSSVQGLDPEAVSVADTSGSVLVAPGSGMAEGVAGSSQQQQTDAFEVNLASEIRAMLVSVVGGGKATVTVNADLDFDKRQATSETFTEPVTADGERAPREQSTRTEEYAGAVPQDAGVLGAEQAAAGAGAAADGSSYTSNEERTSYAVNREVATTETAPGQVRRLSVAVLVDEAAIGAERVADVEALVNAAAGISAERGDQVVVTRMSFDDSQALAAETELAAAEAAQRAEARQRQLTTIATALVVLVVLALAYRSVRGSRRKRKLAADLASAQQSVASTLLEQQLAAEALGPVDLTAIESAVPAQREIGPSSVQARVASMVEEQPEEVALLLRSWLGDRRAVKR